MRVCFAVTDVLGYPQAGGHLWVFANWVLGLTAAGVDDVVLLDEAPHGWTPDELRARASQLREQLAQVGVHASLAVFQGDGHAVAAASGPGFLPLDDALSADLFLNQNYGLPADLVRRARRSALLDIDPGLLQVWASHGWMPIARHDRYFTIGETVGRDGSPIPTLGLDWEYTPPVVALGAWPVTPALGGAAFSTVTHWQADTWMIDEGERYYRNDKRSSFLRFRDLPLRTGAPLELAVGAMADEDREALATSGWRLRDAWQLAASLADYRRYVQGSLGEFSVAKPAYSRLDTAWLSDRTLCYLASGKPAVVEHTGPSRFLPDDEGLFRVHDVAQAARAIDRILADYDHHCLQARALAEEHFDARLVATRLLERALE
jgi:hypothetical protein